MSKLLLGAVAGIGAIGGGAYYVSQVAVPDIDTPPYLAAGDTATVFATLGQMPLPTEIARYDSSINPQLAAIGDVRIIAEPEANRLLRWTFMVDNVRYVTISASLKPVGDKTAVDVRAAFPDSPFTQSGRLHPYDVKVLAAAFDLAATEYIASVFEKRPLRSWSSLGRAFETKLGFDRDQKDALGLRVQAALAVVTRPLVERAMARSGASSEDIARAMEEASDAMASSGYDGDRSSDGYRGRNLDPRQTMRSGVQPSASAEPMVDVGNGR